MTAFRRRSAAGSPDSVQLLSTARLSSRAPLPRRWRRTPCPARPNDAPDRSGLPRAGRRRISKPTSLEETLRGYNSGPSEGLDRRPRSPQGGGWRAGGWSPTRRSGAKRKRPGWARRSPPKTSQTETPAGRGGRERKRRRMLRGSSARPPPPTGSPRGGGAAPAGPSKQSSQARQGEDQKDHAYAFAAGRYCRPMPDLESGHASPSPSHPSTLGMR